MLAGEMAQCLQERWLSACRRDGSVLAGEMAQCLQERWLSACRRDGSVLAGEMAQCLQERWLSACRRDGSVLAGEMAQCLQERWLSACRRDGSVLAGEMAQCLQERWLSACTRDENVCGRSIVAAGLVKSVVCIVLPLLDHTLVIYVVQEIHRDCYLAAIHHQLHVESRAVKETKESDRFRIWKYVDGETSS